MIAPSCHVCSVLSDAMHVVHTGTDMSPYRPKFDMLRVFFKKTLKMGWVVPGSPDQSQYRVSCQAFPHVGPELKPAACQLANYQFCVRDSVKGVNMSVLALGYCTPRYLLEYERRSMKSLNLADGISAFIFVFAGTQSSSWL
jgi:hypothetical protein